MYEYLDKRYATALYEVAEEKGKIEEYLQSLREVVDVIYGNEDILDMLKHSDISTDLKKKTFIELFSERVEEELLSFLLILIDKGRILYIREKLGEMEKIHLERNYTLVAEVKTAVPLIEDERIAIIRKLESMYNRKILLKEEIDETILGGVFLRVGSDTIDDTVRTRLYEIKDRIMRTR